ncbi:sugar-binding domain-containing protein [Sagittula sp.]|uniref:sugar-binding domain-containing protein n=1 Tax=Sagittula sp. TaxID=2038081 RepID=UPI003519D6B2
MARRLSAQCINLNAPAVCSDAGLAAQLRAEPIIAQQLDRRLDCNKAIHSLSPCTFDTHVVQFNLATEADISDYRAKGALGIIAGRFIDTEGAPVLGDLDRRMIGADQQILRGMEGLLVVPGRPKLEAIRAALRGGYADHVVIDTALAEELARERAG